MYLAPAIDQVLEDKKSKLLGRPTYYQIAGILTRGYKRAELPFKFRFETFDDYGPDDLSVSGLYDMEEDVKYIILNFPKEQKHYSITNENWREFKFAVSQVCQHETIHELQWQNRETDGVPCAIDFRNLTGSISEEKEYLEKLLADKGQRLGSNIYRGSVDGFMYVDFHSRCDGVGPTVSLFKVKQN
jgi:hypothetical protein